MNKLFYLIGLILISYSCKTDFEINAPYEKIPIIFGVLDQSADTQFIKINKSFLGTNNTSYASINDSMYFDNVNVRIEEIDDNGTINRVFSLQEKTVPVAAGSGIFFTGQQKVYYFTETLDETKSYRIIGDGDGQPFSATTNLISDFTFDNQFRTAFNSPLGIGWYNSGVYTNIDPKWNQSPEGKSYDVSIRFNYTEYRNGNVVPLFIDWYVGSSNYTSSGQLSLQTNARSFFAYLSNNAQLQDTVGVTKRVIGKVEIRITSVNQILETYIDVNKPNNNISFDKPDYTNIEGGRGVFGSRYTIKLESNKKFNEKTTEHMHGGIYTSALLFCSDEAAWNTEVYYCP